MSSQSWELGEVYVWGFTDPACGSYDPALAEQPGKPFSTLVRGSAPILREISRTLCPIGNGLLQPIMMWERYYLNEFRAAG